MKTFHRFTFIIGVCLTLSWLIGCKPSQPRGIISYDDMEDLLYDYHIADAMAQTAKGGYQDNVLTYRAAVLKKHGVTQSEFDSSMVYYMRHADQLHNIYEDLADRLQNESRALGGDATLLSAGVGDSANVWNGQRSIILIPNQPYNVFSFSLKTDSTFHRGDQVMLSFNTDFIFQDGIRDGVAMLAVTFNNDSVCQRVNHISSSMPTVMQIDDADSIGIKMIRGFFLLTKNDNLNTSMTTLQLMCISNIKLIRLRPKNQPQPAQPMPSQIPVNKEMPDSERMRPTMSPR